MTEFTGERVIPGAVDSDLWNEHLARYAFASRYAFGRRVLDIGCGAGYGSALLAKNAAAVIACDIAPEAVEYARSGSSLPNVRYVLASCEAIPLVSAQTDLIVAFEVIEHVAGWRAFLAEARRLLAPRGMFLVSTPNIHYYAETRRQSGPNRFHQHEFEYGEFAAELRAVFPHLAMFLQNHSDSLVFQPVEPTTTAEARLESSSADPAEAHFFVALCSLEPLPPAPAFVFLPSTANVLREREIHIEKLQGELATKDQWLRETAEQHTALLAEHRQLHDLFREQEGHLETANRWAQQLDTDLTASGERVLELQRELAGEQRKAAATVEAYESKVAELERENEEKTAWARATEARLGAELQAKCEELAKCVDILHGVEAERDERSLHAASLERSLAEATQALEAARAWIAMAQSSRWVRLGRAVGVGPDLGQGTQG